MYGTASPCWGPLAVPYTSNGPHHDVFLLFLQLVCSKHSGIWDLPGSPRLVDISLILRDETSSDVKIEKENPKTSCMIE